MDQSKTSIFSLESLEQEVVRQVLKDVYLALEERGYQPVNQLVGYLMSGDPGYISSYKDARKKISRLDRNHIIEVLLKDSLEKD